ncbi:LTA synthase family protein [Terribacillus saccharophilus]|uniref:LTA synthase family protein n=1 Tax=Terribacillus saccharophilus TaxID=361277 RepID=UPI0038205108
MKRTFTAPLYILATVLFGLKTYIIYRFLFNISLDNAMQEFILLLNPFVSAFLAFGLSVLFSRKWQMRYIRFISLVGSIILYINLIFYRHFSDFLTVPVLMQGSNAADLGGSVLSLIYPQDILLVLDLAIIWFLSYRYKEKMTVDYVRRKKVSTMAAIAAVVVINIGLAEVERPQLFTRGFDREYLVKNIGLFNFHVYDAVMQSKTEAQRVFADGNELPEILSYVNEEVETEKSAKFGQAEGKNVIFISLESMQSFLINNELNGEEVTPFLNSLTEDKDTYYFENFYHQTEQGKTSDSEFLVENSIYPLPRGAVFFTHGQNEYNGTPEILGQSDYTTAVFHSNNSSFWNRDVMYDSLGYDTFYDENSYDVIAEGEDQNTVGWGLMDKPFFEQSIPYLQEMDKPYYSKFITLTNHHPFDLPEEEATIDQFDSNSQTLNKYFQTARYTDEAVQQFFEQLKESGEYEDSIIVMMGDHYGISEYHNKAMSQYLGKDITPYQQVQNQRVPFFIHIPGDGNGQVMEQVAGQIDVKPTILSLLGVEAEHDIQFGNDVFAEDRKDFTALRNGDFISDEYLFTNDMCYDRLTGEPAEDMEGEEAEISGKTGEQIESVCEPIQEQVTKELNYSDRIIYGDLLRFYDFQEGKEKAS